MKSHRVLLVEDEAEEAGRLRRCLGEMGCRVVATASNGRDAIEEARYHKPNLVLMDIVLPGDMDGIETSQKIRDDMDIPIIYITAYSDRGYLDLIWDTDPFGYIPKPCDATTLKASIQVAMHRKSREISAVDSRERYRKLFQMVGDPIVVFYMTNDVIHYVNDHLCRLVNRPAEEVIGSRVWELFPEENVSLYKSFIDDIPNESSSQYELMLLTRSDGDVVPVEASSYSGRLDSTEMTILLFRDLSRKSLVEWEKRLVDALKRATKKRGRDPEIYTICAHCKKVKDATATNHWRNLESFFYHTLGIEFSHGICPECLKGYYTQPDDD